MATRDHVESLLMPVLALAIALAAVAVTAVPAAAQDAYPSRPVEVVVTFPPGGPLDAAIRIIQPRLAANLGGTLVLATKGGAGGALGMDAVAKARPDGYTLVAGVQSSLTILPATRSDLTYKLSDFAIIGTYAVDSQGILARAGGPIRTLEDMIEQARKNPGALSYGSAGTGTISHLNMELLKAARGIDMTHVPFAGTGPVKSAVLGGHVAIATTALSPLLPLVRSGDLIALATTAPRRIPGLENVPTLAEKGLAEAALSTTMQILAPARTPREVVDKLVRALEKTAQEPAVVTALERAGMFAEYRDPETTRRAIEAEHESLAKITRKLGLAK